MLTTVTATRNTHPGRRQQPVLALKLDQPAQAAMARVDIDHQQAGRHPSADVGLGPPPPPASHPDRVAGRRIQPMAQLVAAVGRLVGPVAGRPWLAGRGSTRNAFGLAR